MVKAVITRNEAVSPVETPTQSTVKAAGEMILLPPDPSGRVIGIKKLGTVERLRMLKLIGGNNEHYIGMAGLAFLVASIDGESIAKPVNEVALEGLIQRLGDDGLNAIADGASLHFGTGEAGDKAALKNS